MKSKNILRISSMLMAFALFISLFSFFAYSEDVFTLEGTLIATNVYVRTGPGTNNSQLKTKGGTVIKLNPPQKFAAEDKECASTDSNSLFWYHIKFTYSDGNVYEGYIRHDFASVVKPTPEEAAVETEDVEPIVPETEEPEEPLFDFEESIKNFPEDYKDKLRAIHELHPNWLFVPFITNYDWNYVQQNENIKKRSLINSTVASYRSTASSDYYDWYTDTFKPLEGSTWYQAAPEVVAYYMDPRNFLTTDNVFQFLKLSFDPKVQNLNGVKSMLKGTFMENAVIKTPEGNDITYAETFMIAAEKNNVSPYHLVARCIQEVGRSGTAAGACGTYKPSSGIDYSGYYNFYNIGAGSGAEEGMKYAMKTNESEMRPWNSQYKSIVGGASFLASSYFNRGQDTLYYQKYNVVEKDKFYHQYMANISAPYSEAITMRKNFASLDLMNTPFVFSIPVYKNMPKNPCKMPASAGSPNNWLKTITVGNFPLSPAFSMDNSSQNYTVIVNEKVSSVTVSATPVSKSAYTSGTGVHMLSTGSNTIKVVCTAANGNEKTYNLTVKLLSPNTKIPAAPTLKSKTSSSITLNTVSGCEYSKDGTTWQKTSSFTGLESGKTYDFYLRYSATSTLLPSEKGPKASFTTDKGTQNPPPAPTVSENYCNKIVLANEKSGVQYSSDGINWKDSPVFEGLKADTEYSFYCRYVETSTALASAKSEALTVKTACHRYEYIYESLGYHSRYCPICEYSTEPERHKYNEGVCICGFEEPSENQFETGDIDLNGIIDDNDAVYLLYYTFFPEEYPINGNCDFDNNGVVDDKDAVYLLYYTFFPEEYPLTLIKQ